MGSMSPDDKLSNVEQATGRIQMYPPTIRRLVRDAITGRRIGTRQGRMSESDPKGFIEGGADPAPVAPPVSPPTAPVDASSRDGHRKPRPTKAVAKPKTAAKKPPAKRK